MAFAIVHLSDIHYRRDVCFDSNRIPRIVKALRGVDSSIKDCLTIISGDIAFSGQADEYISALDFITYYESSLKDCGFSLHIAMVPGNHDCNFAYDSGNRKRLIEAINSGTCKVDKNDIETCTSVQNEFYKFYSLWNDIKQEDRLCYFQNYTIDNAKVAIQCINTAWVSTLKEKQGQLYPPDTLICLEPDRHADVDLVISTFHHPYPWFNSSLGRQFRRQIEESSDIIVTGHEHDADNYLVTRAQSISSFYLEGGVLFDSTDINNSTYNIMLVDIERRRKKVYKVEWDKDLYLPIKEDVEWEVISRRHINRFENNQGFIDELCDPGATFAHPRKSKLFISDIFVKPMFKEMYTDEKGGSRYLDYDHLMDVLNTRKKIAILGSEKTGRTVMAKKLYELLQSKNIVPLMIDGLDMNSFDEERIGQIIKSKFNKQYCENDYPYYSQLENSKRAVIIDNYHLISLNERGKRKQIRALEKFFDYVVIFGSELTPMESILVEGDDKGLLNYKIYRIEPLGYVARSELIKNWVVLGQEYDIDLEYLSVKCTQLERLINAVIGKNIVPSYPLFILTILQGIEMNLRIDTSHGTYGFVYDILVRAAFSKGHQRIDLNTKEGFLSFLAYRMFTNDVQELSFAEVEKTHTDYCNLYRKINRLDIENDLLESDLLIKDDYRACYRFKYKYFYYYFTAKYMSNQITSEEVRFSIENVVSGLHTEAYANIAMFLSYMCKDSILIDKILASAARMFPDETSCTLEEDVTFIEALNVSIPEMVLNNKDPEENRKKLLQIRDKFELHEQDKMESDTSEADSVSIVAEINKAMKCIQVIGQLARNYPGTLPKATKVLMVNECYQLGMKIISYLLSIIKDNLEPIIQETHESMSLTSNMNKIERYIYSLIVVLVINIVSGVTHSVGTINLSDVFDEIIERNPNLPVKFIDFMIRLNYFKGFPTRELDGLLDSINRQGFTGFMLKAVIYAHMYTTRINRVVKQQICQKVGIKTEDIRLIELRKSAHNA